MLRDNGFRLLTLGRLALVGAAGDTDDALNTRRRKVALLAVLALANRPVSRDSLVEMFWGEQDEVRARHSLSDAISHLRRVIGRDVIVTTRSEASLAREASLTVDAVELAEAMAERDYERALALYRGPFLDGVYVGGSPSFEQWVARERSRLEALFLRASDRQCLSLARARRWEECAVAAEQWLEAAPLSADAALYLMNALKAPGTAESLRRALEAYERLRARLARELDLAPDRTVQALAADLGERLAAAASLPDSVSDRGSLSAQDTHTSTTTSRQLRETPPSLGDVADAASAPIGRPAPPEGRATTGGVTSTGGPPPIDEGSVEPAKPSHHDSAVDITWSHLAVPAPGTEAASPPVGAGSRRGEPLRLPHRGEAARWWVVAGVAVVVGVAVLAGAALAVRARRTPSSQVARSTAAAKPSIAVATFRVTSGDTTLAWLADGLPQMMAAKLGRSGGIDVVAPTQVRAVELRAGYDRRSALSADQARDLGRRVGAGIVVRGDLARDADTLVLSLTVQDVASGRVLRTDALANANALSLADEAAARILAGVRAEGAGMRLADLETSSVAAYQHYVAAMNAVLEGRGTEARRELDAAIALDSGFVSALQLRWTMAVQANEEPIKSRLSRALQRHAARATEYERLEQQAVAAFFAGERERSEALARQLVQRYPRDPRAYGWLSNFLDVHGRWDLAEGVLREALAIDSLGMEAGSGPCVPCLGYAGLVLMRLARADREGAERAAQRYVSLQPEAPGAWSTLAWAFAYSLRYDEALSAQRRAVALAGSDPAALEVAGRLLVMARRFAEADSAITEWSRPGGDMRAMALDLRAMLQRERGQLRASNRTIDSLDAIEPGGALTLLRGNTLARLGDYAGAARVYEEMTHGPARKPLPDLHDGGAVRAFCWHHALLADALAGSGMSPGMPDTVRIHAIGDTLRTICDRSYYARDWRLYHHVRGLLAMRGGRYEEAVRELEAAKWTRWGWTRTNAEQADAYLRLGRPNEAIAALRDAYAPPLDAMARYLPRSELDYRMALAFRAAGMPDSAAVYAAYVRSAWKDADPEVRRLLARLP